MLILAALLTVYIVLGMLYESYIHPITILSTLPSAGVGALLALLLTRHRAERHRADRHHPADRHRQEERHHDDRLRPGGRAQEGKGPEEAIYEACLLRFRPIMMTTMAALLGALPLALGHGVGSELRRPLGIAIVGGLIFSQMLTLYTTPVIYLYLDRFRLWIADVRKNRGRRVESVPTPGLRQLKGRRVMIFRNLALAAVAGMLALLSACATVGPNYVKPAPLPPQTKAVLPLSYVEADGWRIAQPKDNVLRGNWWEIYAIPELDALEQQVAAANQNVAQAEANYRQAQALVRASRSGFYPSVAAGASATRTQYSSEVSTLGIQNNFLLPVDFSWEIDLWGRVRRTVEASQASAQASQSDLASATLSAQSLLAQEYFLLRTVDAQKKVLEDTIVGYQKTLDLTKNRYAAGVASRVGRAAGGNPAQVGAGTVDRPGGAARTAFACDGAPRRSTAFRIFHPRRAAGRDASPRSDRRAFGSVGAASGHRLRRAQRRRRQRADRRRRGRLLSERHIERICGV